MLLRLCCLLLSIGLRFGGDKILSDRFLKGSQMMRQVAIILRYYCGGRRRSTIVACCCWAYYNWEPQEGAVNTNFDDNGDVFCKGVNPELLISLLTKNPCHIDTNSNLLHFSYCWLVSVLAQFEGFFFTKKPHLTFVGYG